MLTFRFILVLTLTVFAMCCLQAEVSVTKIVPEKLYYLGPVKIDPVSGMIAVLKNEHDNIEVAVYNADGKLRSRFRTASVFNLAWLPGSTILAPVIFPNRGEVPYLYSPDGKLTGRFGKNWPLLQMFVHNDQWAGADITPGGRIA